MCFQVSYSFACGHKLRGSMVSCTISDERPDQALCDPLDPAEVVEVENANCDKCDPSRLEANAAIVKQDEERRLTERLARQSLSRKPVARAKGKETQVKPRPKAEVVDANVPIATERPAKRALRPLPQQPQAVGPPDTGSADDDLNRVLRLSAQEYEAQQPSDDVIQKLLRLSLEEYEANQPAEDELERALQLSAKAFTDSYGAESEDAALARAIEESKQGREDIPDDDPEFRQVLLASIDTAVQEEYDHYKRNNSKKPSRWYRRKKRWACGCIHDHGTFSSSEPVDADGDGVMWEQEQNPCPACVARSLRKGKGKAQGKAVG